MYNIRINSFRFEWDPIKAISNLNKHKVSFEEAKSAFYDDLARLIDDLDHSADEERFILLGRSHTLRVVVVCHCYRGKNGVIRIISARKATSQESKAYERWLMRKEYDFSNARKNPYAAQLKKSITIRLDEDSIAYFKSISDDVGIPYQSLINLYLRDCANSRKKLNLSWKWIKPGWRTSPILITLHEWERYLLSW